MFDDVGQYVFERSLDCVTRFESGAVFLRRLSEVSRMSVEGATEDTADSI